MARAQPPPKRPRAWPHTQGLHSLQEIRPTHNTKNNWAGFSPERRECQTCFLSMGPPRHGQHAAPRNSTRVQRRHLTLYKNHRRFCTRTRGHRDESLPSPTRGECHPPFSSPGHDSHFQRIKNEPSTDTAHAAGHCTSTAQPHVWLRVPQQDVTVGRGKEGLRPPPLALCIEATGASWHQQPEPGAVSIPVVGMPGWGKVPHVPGRHVGPCIPLAPAPTPGVGPEQPQRCQRSSQGSQTLMGHTGLVPQARWVPQRAQAPGMHTQTTRTLDAALRSGEAQQSRGSCG